MSTNYKKGYLVFYIDGNKRTLAFVNNVLPQGNELEIYYLDDNYDIHKKIVRSDEIRQAIRGSGSGTTDVMDEKNLQDKHHVRTALIKLSDLNINEFQHVQGGTHKSKRRKSRHHKKTNHRRRKSNRRRKSQRKN